MYIVLSECVLRLLHDGEKRFHAVVKLIKSFYFTHMLNGPADTINTFCKGTTGVLRNKPIVRSVTLINDERCSVGSDFGCFCCLRHWHTAFDVANSCNELNGVAFYTLQRGYFERQLKKSPLFICSYDLPCCLSSY